MWYFTPKVRSAGTREYEYPNQIVSKCDKTNFKRSQSVQVDDLKVLKNRN